MYSVTNNCIFLLNTMSPVAVMSGWSLAAYNVTSFLQRKPYLMLATPSLSLSSLVYHILPTNERVALSVGRVDVLGV